MAQARMPQLSTAMTVLAAIVFLLVLADLAFAAVLATRNASVQLSPVAASQKAAHPCNHGFYVSQAAHAKKGGQYTSGIAQSDLGKNGNCSAPLPAQAPAKKKGSGS
jgi:hypothetical protein